MKKFLLLAFIFGLIGCGNNKKINLIESFVCTIDGVTSDLNFKSLKLGEVQPIFATDSLLFFWCDTIALKYTWHGDTLFYTYPYEDGSLINNTFSRARLDSSLISSKNFIESNLTFLNNCKGKLEETFKKYPFDMEFMNFQQETIDMIQESLNESKEYIAKLESAKKYSQMPSDTVLLRAFDCTYSILNPLLKVKQTQTQTFYFDSELTKVICSSDYKK